MKPFLKAAIEKLHGVYLDVSAYRGKFNQILEKIDKHGKTSNWQWAVDTILAVWALAMTVYALFRC